MVIGLLMMLYVLSLKVGVWDVRDQFRRSWERCRNSGACRYVGAKSFMAMSSMLVGRSASSASGRVAIAVVAAVS